MRIADVGAVVLGLYAVSGGIKAHNRYVQALLTAGVLMVVGALLAMLRSGDPVEDARGLAQFLFAIVFVPWLMLRLVNTERRLLLALTGLVASATIASAVALVSDVTGLWFLPFPDEARGIRAFGLSTDPGPFGLWVATAVPVAVGLVLTGRGALRRLAGLSLPLLVAGLVMSGTRAALVSAVAATVMVAFLLGGGSWRRRLTILGALAGVGIVAGALFYSSISRVVGESAELSNQGRLAGYEQALERLNANPFVGEGASEVKVAHGGTGADARLRPEGAKAAHNLYLQTWVAIGLAGLVAVVIVMVAAALGGARTVGSPYAGDRIYGWLLLSALLVVFATQLSTAAVFERQVWLVVGLVIAVAVNRRERGWHDWSGKATLQFR